MDWKQKKKRIKQLCRDIIITQKKDNEIKTVCRHIIMEERKSIIKPMIDRLTEITLNNKQLGLIVIKINKLL